AFQKGKEMAFLEKTQEKTDELEQCQRCGELNSWQGKRIEELEKANINLADNQTRNQGIIFDYMDERKQLAEALDSLALNCYCKKPCTNDDCSLADFNNIIKRLKGEKQ